MQRPLLFVLLLPPDALAQEVTMTIIEAVDDVERTDDGYPVDRAHCDSSNKACTLGLPELASVYPILSEEPFYQTSQFDEREYDEATHEPGPVPDAIDYSGGLQPSREEYVDPTSWEREGVVVYTGSEVTVLVTGYGVFEPANISVAFGTKVTWQLDTFESVAIVSDATEIPTPLNASQPDGEHSNQHFAEGELFDSGVINRLSHPMGFSHVFGEGEGAFAYTNQKAAAAAASLVPPVKVLAVGGVTVSGMACESFPSCSVCLLYSGCIWCSGNGTCLARNATTNLPLDTAVVIEAMPAGAVEEGDEPRGYDHLKWYNPERSIYGLDWYPWPQQRTNPRPIKDEAENPLNLGLAATPTESARCSAYVDMQRGAAVCPEYREPPILNRVHGLESATRPRHQTILDCYQLVKERYGRGDADPPTTVAGGEEDAAGAAGLASDGSGTDESADSSTDISADDADATDGAVINASSNASASTNASNGSRSNATSAAGGALARRLESPRRELVGGGRDERPGRASDAAMMAGGARGGEAPDAAVSWHAVSPADRWRRGGGAGGGAGGSAGARSRGSGAGRRLSEGGQAAAEPCAMAWHELSQADIVACAPYAQQLLLTARERKAEHALTLLRAALVARSGHRCNATHDCDTRFATCVNSTGGQILGWDQNGTCSCHGWFTSDDCSQVDVSGDNCVVGEGVLRRTLSAEACALVRVGLYLCGVVEALDNMPAPCVALSLSVVQCLEAGHLRAAAGYAGAAYAANLLGHPEDGQAMSVCAKCMSSDGGTIRPETATRVCAAEVRARCQRDEEATNQRLCNLCHEDELGSVEEGHGYDKACSFYRGTCVGSVEKRIRGIVPPNVDIVGANDYGGLRYCTTPTTFSSEQHYYTEADIMQPGQSCLDYRATFTTWNHVYQKDHEDTVKDAHGLACLEPENARTCPMARRCVSADLCHVDWPDWTKNELLDERWGLDVADYLDPTAHEEHHWAYVTREYSAMYLENIDWGIHGDSERRRLGMKDVRQRSTRDEWADE